MASGRSRVDSRSYRIKRGLSPGRIRSRVRGIAAREAAMAGTGGIREKNQRGIPARAARSEGWRPDVSGRHRTAVGYQQEVRLANRSALEVRLAPALVEAGLE